VKIYYNEFVRLPKLEPSRNVSSKVISNRTIVSIVIWSHRSKEMKIYRTISLQAFLSPQRANVTQSSNHLPQILTQWSNLTPQRAKNTVNDLLVVDIKQVEFTPSSLFSWDQQTAVEWKHFFIRLKKKKNCSWMHWEKKDLHEEGLDRFSGSTGKEYCESTGKCNSMVQLFTSTGRDLDNSTITLSTSTSKEYCAWAAKHLKISCLPWGHH